MAVLVDDLFDRVREGVRVGDVAGEGLGGASLRIDRAADVLELVRAAGDGDDVEAVLRESPDDRGADASGAAGEVVAPVVASVSEDEASTEPSGDAQAIPAGAATAVPIPSATANAPTRPTYLP